MRRRILDTLFAIPILFSLLLLASIFRASFAADKKAARATVRVVYSQGGSALVQPVLPVQLQVVRLGGDLSKPIPVEFLTCDVFSREVASNDKAEQTYTVTVLRCGGEEYGIQGILFAEK